MFCEPFYQYWIYLFWRALHYIIQWFLLLTMWFLIFLLDLGLCLLDSDSSCLAWALDVLFKLLEVPPKLWPRSAQEDQAVIPALQLLTKRALGTSTWLVSTAAVMRPRIRAAASVHLSLRVMGVQFMLGLPQQQQLVQLHSTNIPVGLNLGRTRTLLEHRK